MLEFVTKFGFAPIFLLAVMVRKNCQSDFALPQESVKVNVFVYKIVELLLTLYFVMS